VHPLGLAELLFVQNDRDLALRFVDKSCMALKKPAADPLSEASAYSRKRGGVLYPPICRFLR
jgi:hypothetical protein